MVEGTAVIGGWRPAESNPTHGAAANMPPGAPNCKLLPGGAQVPPGAMLVLLHFGALCIGTPPSAIACVDAAVVNIVCQN